MWAVWRGEFVACRRRCASGFIHVVISELELADAGGAWRGAYEIGVTNIFTLQAFRAYHPAAFAHGDAGIAEAFFVAVGATVVDKVSRRVATITITINAGLVFRTLRAIFSPAVN